MKNYEETQNKKINSEQNLKMKPGIQNEMEEVKT